MLDCDLRINKINVIDHNYIESDRDCICFETISERKQNPFARFEFDVSVFQAMQDMNECNKRNCETIRSKNELKKKKNIIKYLCSQEQSRRQGGFGGLSSPKQSSKCPQIDI